MGAREARRAWPCLASGIPGKKQNIAPKSGLNSYESLLRCSRPQILTLNLYKKGSLFTPIKKMTTELRSVTMNSCSKPNKVLRAGITGGPLKLKKLSLRSVPQGVNGHKETPFPRHQHQRHHQHGVGRRVEAFLLTTKTTGEQQRNHAHQRKSDRGISTTLLPPIISFLKYLIPLLSLHTFF